MSDNRQKSTHATSLTHTHSRSFTRTHMRVKGVANAKLGGAVHELLCKLIENAALHKHARAV